MSSTSVHHNFLHQPWSSWSSTHLLSMLCARISFESLRGCMPGLRGRVIPRCVLFQFKAGELRVRTTSLQGHDGPRVRVPCQFGAELGWLTQAGPMRRCCGLRAFFRSSASYSSCQRKTRKQTSTTKVQPAVVRDRTGTVRGGWHGVTDLLCCTPTEGELHLPPLPA